MCMKDVKLINTDNEGNAICIKANYFKMGKKNFIPQFGGMKYAATSVLEIEYGIQDSCESREMER